MEGSLSAVVVVAAIVSVRPADFRSTCVKRSGSQGHRIDRRQEEEREASKTFPRVEGDGVAPGLRRRSCVYGGRG